MCIHPRCRRRPIATLHKSKWGDVELCDHHLPGYRSEGTHASIEYHRWYVDLIKEAKV